MNQGILDLQDDKNDSFTMACGERPQERMENFGVSALSDTELIAMVLQGNGTRPEDALMVAGRLIAEAGSIIGLAAWQAVDYRRLKGISRIKGVLRPPKAWRRRKNRLLKRFEISSGTATAALAHPREVFRAAIRESACAIVCVHNTLSVASCKIRSLLKLAQSPATSPLRTAARCSSDR